MIRMRLRFWKIHGLLKSISKKCMTFFWQFFRKKCMNWSKNQWSFHELRSHISILSTTSIIVHIRTYHQHSNIYHPHIIINISFPSVCLLERDFFFFSDPNRRVTTNQLIVAVFRHKKLSNLSFSKLKMVGFFMPKMIQMRQASILINHGHPLLLCFPSQMKRDIPLQRKFIALGHNLNFLILTPNFKQFKAIHLAITQSLHTNNPTTLFIILKF